MLADVAGSLVAVLAFTALLYAPGYLAGYATDLFGFRRMAFAKRSLWAIACSFALAPIAAYLVGRIGGLTAVCSIFGIGAFGTVSLFVWESRVWEGKRVAWSGRERRLTALVACGWTAFALLMLVDVQIGHKLYFSVVTADQSYRIAFTDAVVRTGIPPANPLYFAGTPAPMPYYYFWYVLCAAVVRCAHVSARQAFIASSIWAGFGLLATVGLYGRCFFRWRRRQRWLAMGLLLISGADLLPALGQALLQPSLNGDTEWWSVDPVDGWPDSLLWVPHHVAGVLCCLLGFLFLWRITTTEDSAHSSRAAALGLAIAAFASAFGLSTYVAFGFALMIAAWMLWLGVTRHPKRFVFWRSIAVAGLLSGALLLPFLRELVSGLPGGVEGRAVAGTSPPTHLFSISVRRMIDSGLVTGLPMFAGWNRTHPVLLDQTVRLILLLPGLALELGLYGAVLVLLLAAKRRKAPAMNDPERKTSLFFVVCGLVLSMFLSSGVITNNDFGYRAVMLPQFFLLLLTADVLGSWWIGADPGPVNASPGNRRLLGSLLVLGGAGFLYWAFLLRAWLPLETARPRNGFRGLPAEAYQVREAFAILDRVAPRDAVVAFRLLDPTPDRGTEVMTPNEFRQRLLVMDAGRQMLNAEGKCATHFGGDPRACTAIQRSTAAMYASPPPSAASAEDYCRRFGVQYLVLGAWDPDWRAAVGWPVTLPVVAGKPGLRIVQCP